MSGGAGVEEWCFEWWNDAVGRGKVMKGSYEWCWRW